MLVDQPFIGRLFTAGQCRGEWGAGRATVRQVANRIFASQFAGTVRLGSLQRLDTETLTVSELTVATPAGEQVLTGHPQEVTCCTSFAPIKARTFVL